MTTNITWKEVVNGGTQTVRIDDKRDAMLEEGEEVVLNNRRYKVVGMETAVVLLEALEPPPADPANPAMKDGKAIVPTEAERARAAGQVAGQRGADEHRSAADHRTPEKATVTGARHVEPKSHTAAPAAHKPAAHAVHPQHAVSHKKK